MEGWFKQNSDKSIAGKTLEDIVVYVRALEHQKDCLRHMYRIALEEQARYQQNNDWETARRNAALEWEDVLAQPLLAVLLNEKPVWNEEATKEILFGAVSFSGKAQGQNGHSSKKRKQSHDVPAGVI